MFGKTNISSKLSVNCVNFTPLNEFVLICACLVGGPGKYSEEPYQKHFKIDQNGSEKNLSGYIQGLPQWEDQKGLFSW